tara:strand:+ start:871 stop:1092 length:222 start_codon:yes stop_codon:yes gene_type:complete
MSGSNPQGKWKSTRAQRWETKPGTGRWDSRKARIEREKAAGVGKKRKPYEVKSRKPVTITVTWRELRATANRE